ncbi:hypothetical protein PRIPAC_89876 [Pristionchus pacificus]|nr:hypothetical protein PRIPAC_89876 [Pristionchus pacificus]
MLIRRNTTFDSSLRKKRWQCDNSNWMFKERNEVILDLSCIFMTSVCDALLVSSDEEEDELEDPTSNDKEVREKEGHLSESESNEDEEEDEEGDDEDEEEDDDEGEDDDDEINQLTAPKPINVSVGGNKTFSELGLSSWISDQLKELNITKSTPVQEHCIPKVLEGSDVLGCAKTGTGKTMAFALPILHQLSIDPYGVYALVLTPTRELAFQIGDQFQAVGAPINIKISVIVGGRDQVIQSSELTRRPHVVIATPGRLADHIESHPENITKIFAKLQFLVLDEADRLLDGQYAIQMKTVMGALPRKRQTLLFSATITSALSQLHQVSIRKPFFFEDTSDVATVEKLDQKYVICPQAVKDAYVVYVVRECIDRRPDSSIIIFAHTCRECQALAHMFAALGFSVGSLHSQIPQAQRLNSLAQFRSKKLKVLICTDVAARGLDIPHVDVVVNHSLPQCPKTYVHRVGRSARAGRFGSALSFVTQYDVVLLQAIEKLIGKKIDQLNVNEKKVSKEVTQVLVSKREAEIRLEEEGFGERKETNIRKQLLLQGMNEKAVDEIMDERKARRNGKISERSEEKKGKKRKRDGESSGEKKMKKKKE